MVITTSYPCTKSSYSITESEILSFILGEVEGIPFESTSIASPATTSASSFDLFFPFGGRFTF